MASNVNVVVITGNLTKDPELRSVGNTSVCELRVAVNGRRKNGQTGEWEDKANYFTVKAWGARGVNCAKYLSKGRPVAVEGRLDWSEWEAKDGSGKRQKVEIVAKSVQFLGSSSGGEDVKAVEIEGELSDDTRQLLEELAGAAG
jgi:single-strand DNA-binding protein